MSGAAARASAQSAIASTLSTLTEQERRNIAAQYGPTEKLTITECRIIGQMYPKPRA